MPSWDCPKCTFSNDGDRKACEMCDTARPSKNKSKADQGPSHPVGVSLAVGKVKVEEVAHRERKVGRQIKLSHVQFCFSFFFLFIVVPSLFFAQYK